MPADGDLAHFPARRGLLLEDRNLKALGRKHHRGRKSADAGSNYDDVLTLHALPPGKSISVDMRAFFCPS
jgi:hypothetical protein